MSSKTKFHGEISEVQIKDLRLDNKNPRLAEKYMGETQENLADGLRMGHNLLPIAKSMVANGYFNSEPLLVISNSDEDGTWIVVEGNRRAACLKGLTDPEIRRVFDDKNFDALAEETSLTEEDSVPVVVHESRHSAQVEVGKTHIVGKLPWAPYAQARYIATRIREGMSFEDLGDELGIKKGDVSKAFRDLGVADQAVECGVSSQQIEDAYSLVTVAMGLTNLREHVGAPKGNLVKINEPPVPSDKKGELTELIAWIFGTGEEEPKIQESRELSKLAKVVKSEEGLNALREGETLAAALELVSNLGLDPLVRLKQRLNASVRALSAAGEDLTEYANDETVIGLITEIGEIADDFRSTVDQLRE